MTFNLNTTSGHNGLITTFAERQRTFQTFTGNAVSNDNCLLYTSRAYYWQTIAPYEDHHQQRYPRAYKKMDGCAR